MKKLSLKDKFNIFLAIKGIGFSEFAKSINISQSGLHGIVSSSSRKRMPNKNFVVKTLIEESKDLSEEYKITIEDFIINDNK